MLNELFEFAGLNPSVELLAKSLCKGCAGRLQSCGNLNSRSRQGMGKRDGLGVLQAKKCEPDFFSASWGSSLRQGKDSAKKDGGKTPRLLVRLSYFVWLVPG